MQDWLLPTSIGINIMLNRNISSFLRLECFAVKLVSWLSFNELYLMSSIQCVRNILANYLPLGNRFDNDILDV
jgi:hypothetical protein